MKPFISIITLTYNHEKFISVCIESVRHQTYKNWEMIIIDDYSMDKTPLVIKNFSKEDKRIKIILHEKNWGIKKLKESYNQALKSAKGDLIAILEGDDFWPKDKLEKQIDPFIKDKSVVFSFGDWVLTNEKGVGIDLRDYSKFEKKLLSNNPVGSIGSLFLGLDFDIASSTVMIKKRALNRIGGFIKDSYYPYVDIPTYLHLSLQGNFYYQNDILGFYRRHSESTWFNFVKETKAMGREKIQKCINSFYKKSCKKIGFKRLKIPNLKEKQSKYLEIRKKMKIISILLNRSTFSNKGFFLIILEKMLMIRFYIKLFIYKITKIFFNNQVSRLYKNR